MIPRPDRLTEFAAWNGRERADVQWRFPRLGDIHVLRVPPGMTAPGLVERYRRSGLVQCAELDGYLEPAAIPNDPLFTNGALWGLNNTGQMGAVPDADIDAPEAWDISTSAGDVVVAITDSGVRYTHEDLAANIWTNPGEIPNNGRDDDHNGYVDDIHGIDAFASGGFCGNCAAGDPLDETGHGTRVAGILGGVGNNSRGVVGVAWDVRMMVCKFIGSDGGSFADAVQCLEYAQENGARVVNMSVVGPTSSFSLSNAISACGEAGIIIVAAAGNDNGVDIDVSPRYPAAFNLSNIVSVMAIDRFNQRASFSNFGATNVDLAAPGSLIYTTGYTAGRPSDTGYIADSGTSFAAPYVAGALALIWNRYPGEPYWKIIDRLCAAADPVPTLAGRCVTGGRLNLYRALEPRPVLAGRRGPAPGQFTVDLRGGTPSQEYRLERSQDFLYWEPVATNTTTRLGRAQFVDTMVPAGTNYFYRATMGL
ncbi:MAG TPA: S8 family peptidase [Methylomirabilota bacterium]|nr:S8 family peptidase [Methylomirabilota bacterium]